MALIHIVLVNWNGHRDTLECLESLLGLTTDDFCVTVCDNGSTDGSIAALVSGLESARKSLPGAEAIWVDLPSERRHQASVAVVARGEAPPAGARIRLVDTGENLGFAGGNNVGIRLALADPQCQFIWLLNNDTVAAPGALDALVAAMRERPDLAICGSTLLYYHQPDLVQGLGGWYNLALARGGHIGHLGHADALPDRAAVERDVAYVMGASLFARRTLLERTGGLSEDYFLYSEELDLARQLQAQEKQGWAPRSVVYHKEGGSIGTSSIHRPSDSSLYYLQVNTLRFYRKFHPWLLPVAVARILRDGLGAWRRKDGNAIRIGWMALRDFLTGKRRQGAIRLDPRGDIQ
jgi:GT2 family glycosyltransferase